MHPLHDVDSIFTLITFEENGFVLTLYYYYFLVFLTYITFIFPSVFDQSETLCSLLK